jgi:hypothetical protein
MEKTANELAKQAAEALGFASHTWLHIDTLALVASAGLFGTILFFSGVVAPVALRRLPSETSGTFLRALFPWYYFTQVLLAALAAFGFAWHHPIEAGLAAFGLVVVLFAWVWLRPRVSAAKEAAKAGSEAAEKRFRQLHALGMLLNLLVFAVACALLIRFQDGLS